MRTSRSFWGLAAVALSALLPLAGCGGGSPISSPTGASVNAPLSALPAGLNSAHHGVGSDGSLCPAGAHPGWPVVGNLITAGDFNGAPLPTGWDEYTAPALMTGTPWTVGLDSIDLVGLTYWGPGSNTPGNECSVDLDGKADGSISQNFPTVVGKRYRVQFELSGSGAGMPVINTLQVSVDTIPAASMNFAWNNANNHDVYHNKWQKKKWTFKATALTTTLTIASTDNPQSASGAVVTEISVR
jgi:hypothetical protein